MIKINENKINEIEQHVQAISREWRKFMRDEKVDEKIVRPIILESWERSKKLGIDPNKKSFTSRNNEELIKRLKDNQKLIKISSPLLEILASSVQGSGFRIDLFDKDVYILKQWGDSETLENSYKLGSCLGACRSEKLVGTNSIGLAHLLKIPIQLIGPEHYCSRLQQWTCSSSPIKDFMGNIIGIINMTGDYRLIHKHTLGMVIATAKAIENQLRQNEISEKLEIENEYMEATIEANLNTLLIIDENNIIIRVNKIGEEILGLPVEAVLNHKCGDIFGTDNPFTKVLTTGIEIREEEISLRINGSEKIFYSTVKPILTEYHHKAKGVIAFLREIKSIRKIAKRYSAPKARFTFEDLIGRNKEFMKAVAMAKKLANSSVKVLLEGETGTGKELFAQAIHNLSSRRNKPFVAINCAAIPLELMESELFGYEEGAFTGARRGGLLGKIELAEGGTFFLDEISSMPLSLQGKFLRVLETGIIMRVGGRREIVTDIRIISATNEDLWGEIKNGNFREDLFYRINLATIKIPPLRERKDDIPLLVEYFYKRKFCNNQVDIFSIIEDKALQILLSYHWPGNVRELENTIERALLFSSGDKIKAKDLPVYLTQRAGKENDLNANVITTKKIKKLEELEKDSIIEAIKVSDGNITLAAQQLGIARNTFYIKMKKYGINRKNF